MRCFPFIGIIPPGCGPIAQSDILCLIESKDCIRTCETHVKFWKLQVTRESEPSKRNFTHDTAISIWQAKIHHSTATGRPTSPIGWQCFSSIDKLMVVTSQHFYSKEAFQQYQQANTTDVPILRISCHCSSTLAKPMELTRPQCPVYAIFLPILISQWSRQPNVATVCVTVLPILVFQ